MKPLPLLSIALVAPTALFAQTAATEEETAFLDALRAVFEKKDAAAFVAMHCFDGIDQETRAGMEKQIPLHYFRRPLESAEFDAAAQPPGPFRQADLTLVPNLKPEKAILLKFAGEPTRANPSQTHLWIGRKEGRLAIVLAAPQSALGGPGPR